MQTLHAMNCDGFVGVIVSALATLFKQVYQLTTMKIHYHTLILTGEGWVLELLTGHLRQICTELRVSHAIFDKLISTLCSMAPAGSLLNN
jgi:hypothetical protein